MPFFGEGFQENFSRNPAPNDQRLANKTKEAVLVKIENMKMLKTLLIYITIKKFVFFNMYPDSIDTLSKCVTQIPATDWRFAIPDLDKPDFLAVL